MAFFPFYPLTTYHFPLLTFHFTVQPERSITPVPLWYSTSPQGRLVFFSADEIIGRSVKMALNRRSIFSVLAGMECRTKTDYRFSRKKRCCRKSGLYRISRKYWSQDWCWESSLGWFRDISSPVPDDLPRVRMPPSHCLMPAILPPRPSPSRFCCRLANPPIACNRRASNNRWY
jgi:hypothetical protein